MKWYFCIETFGAYKYAPYIMAAVLSCRKHTNLEPICLWHEHEGHVQSDLKAFLHKHDVKVVETRCRVYDKAQEYRSINTAYGTAGTHLRFDIPWIEQEDEFVLYADCDVVFNGAIELDDMRPKFFAAAPEFDMNAWHYFNSGIMVMNLENLRRTSQALVETTLWRMRSGFPVTHDQADLNAFYFEQWERLPQIYNWKPYWGVNDDARIIHFHGPKPADVYIAASSTHRDPLVNRMVDINRPACVTHLINFLNVLAEAGYGFRVADDTGLSYCVPQG